MSVPEPLPSLPVETADFISYVTDNSDKPLRELIKPYLEYESKLRGLFAQDPSNNQLADNTIGLVPVYTGNEADIKVRARNLEAESEEEKAKYLMELDDKKRKKDGERAIVDFDEFKKNFAVFSEGALQNLDWTNIVAAGSSVLTPIIPVPEEHKQTKRALRDYYHEKLAPTSDVDLFIYGTKDEEVAIKRMEAVEATIRDNLLWETTSIRTKNTITIVSQYPNRHIQIVLRLYSSISEILTGFDVSCACVAYDGKQVYANPRAITSWILQCNDIDLTRRSPSYEFRLSKYRQRGFEVFYPSLTREKIDPTIYERNINRLKGLAKLLVLEKLPDAEEREAYLDARRSERGRPARANRRTRKTLRGDLKAQGAEVPEWDISEEEQSNYHTISIPYGKPHNAKRSEKLLFQKDMLLNAEWNKRAQKDRAGYLHRHPAFIGSVKDIVGDCCGYCPEPKTDEEKELQEYDDKTYVRGKLTFLKDDPGRQEIGSFNPITEEDWTEMAYIGDDETLCKAIIANDVEAVKKWLAEPDHDINRRDHTGRTPLHLAALTSTPEIVKLLLDAGSKMIWRIVDGRTALHIAATRGNSEIIKLLLLKSQENEEIRDEREEKERAAKGLSKDGKGEEAAEDEEMTQDEENKDEDEEMEDEADEDEDIDMISDEGESVSARTGASSFVEVNKKKAEEPDSGALGNEDEEEDDILDINLADWDYQMAPLHYAIVNGHKDVVELLVSEFGADVMQPIKIDFDWQGVPRSAMLSISLIVNLKKKEEREAMLRTLLELGASSGQADMNGVSAFMRIVQMGDLDSLKILFEEDAASAIAAAKHVTGSGGWRSSASNALIVAIREGDGEKAMLLLEKGAPPEITFDAFMKATKQDKYSNQQSLYQNFQDSLQQPIELAIEAELPNVVEKCLELGVDPSMYASGSHPPDDLNGGESRYRYNNRYAVNRLMNEFRASEQDWMVDFQRILDLEVEPTLTTSGGRYYSLLDLVRLKIKSFQTVLENMRTEEKKVIKQNSPREMVPEPAYDKDSYEYWMAAQMIKTENKARKKHNKNLERTGGDDWEDPELLKEKEEKIKALEKRYKELADLIVSKGGKTFKELQPEIWKKANQNKADEDEIDDDESVKSKPEQLPDDDFEIKFTYKDANKDEKVNAAYHELYKAAWNGDEEALKKYTTTSWEEDKVPLLIATKNQLGYSLFSIAAYRKHPKTFLDLILSIATAQYAPPEEEEKQYNPYYDGTEDYETDYGSEDENAELRVETIDLTEGKLTIDNIATLGKEVKSKMKAVDLINESIPFIFDYGDDAKDFKIGTIKDGKYKITNGSLLLQAISIGDVELLTYLTSTIEKLNGPATKPNEILFQPEVDNAAVIAIRLQNIEMLENLMRRQGVGALFKEKKENKGKDEEEEEVVEKPKHYLGLSIHGKRRKDWAKAANPNQSVTETGSNQHPLALFAAYHGCHKVFEWLQTDAPEKAIRQWQEGLEKSKNAEENYYLKVLRKADQATYKRWMGTEHPLLLHAIVFNQRNDFHKDTPAEERVRWYEENMKYFLDKNPKLLESQENASGLTPLLVAGSILNIYAMQALINLGADLYAKKPNDNRNLVHIIFNGIRDFGNGDTTRTWEDINDCLSILPDDFKAWAFTQRALGDDVAYTPLGWYINRSSNSYYSDGVNASIVKLALKHSKGLDLGLRTTLGDLPIHSAVKTTDVCTLQTIVDAASPETIVTENANGQTALELADAKRNHHIVSHVPSIEYNMWGGWVYEKSATKMSTRKKNYVWKGETEEQKAIREEQDTTFRHEEWGADEDDCKEVKIWKILDTAVKRVQAANDGSVGRVLVSLREANETAERLANKQSGNRFQRRRRYWYYNNANNDGKDDIVSKWHP
ncbi:hypothetical protein ABW19_dt0206096 [Dactylella cylindrospora]|nr:hypothetical protein ABW19_dt0206096 [Dactylella cylindrospora]